MMDVSNFQGATGRDCGAPPQHFPERTADVRAGRHPVHRAFRRSRCRYTGRLVDPANETTVPVKSKDCSLKLDDQTRLGDGRAIGLRAFDTRVAAHR